MSEVIDITSKLPLSKETVDTINMHKELVEVLNRYHNKQTIKEAVFAGIVTDCLVQILKKAQDKTTVIRVLNYLADELEKV